MASPRGRKGDGATLESCLAEVRAGAPAPVYLFDGDAFLSGRAAWQVAEALVPEPQRSLNLVELDAAASPDEVAAELSTVGLFGGIKVVVLSEPAFLTSKEDQAEPFARARQAWEKGKQREGARRLLALAAKAGWRVQHLAGPEAPGPDDWRRELSVPARDYDAAFVSAAARFALERDLQAGKDDASALDALLQRGLPRGHVLVVAAGKVDGRLPLTKRLAGAGRRVTCAVAKGGSYFDQRLDLRPTIAMLLAGTGKRADGAAVALLAERVGDDARTLASELQKLVSFVGSAPVIGVEDVELLVVRTQEDPFFAFGNAVEARDLPQALAVLDRALAGGGSIHMLIGLLASTLRRMLEEGERARRVAGDRRIGDAREWERLVWPAVGEEERGEKKPYGFWMKYQAATRHGREALLDGLAETAEADLAAKSGRQARPLLEAVLVRLLAGRDRRGAA